jgi:tetratricopeptide (TPR) repeat protein
MKGYLKMPDAKLYTEFNFISSTHKLLTLFAVCFVLLSACSTLPSNRTTISDNSNVIAYLKKAIKAQEQGDAKLAKSYYEEMMDLGAKSPKSLNHYAVFLRSEFEIEEAKGIYQRALKFSPQDTTTHYNLGILYELYLGEFDHALTHYQYYLDYSDVEDKEVKLWVLDLKNRIKAQQAQHSGGSNE